MFCECFPYGRCGRERKTDVWQYFDGEYEARVECCVSEVKEGHATWRENWGAKSGRSADMNISYHR